MDMGEWLLLAGRPMGDDVTFLLTVGHLVLVCFAAGHLGIFDRPLLKNPLSDCTVLLSNDSI